jgi:hypothetical protein
MRLAEIEDHQLSFSFGTSTTNYTALIEDVRQVLEAVETYVQYIKVKCTFNENSNNPSETTTTPINKRLDFMFNNYHHTLELELYNYIFTSPGF